MNIIPEPLTYMYFRLSFKALVGDRHTNNIQSKIAKDFPEFFNTNYPIGANGDHNKYTIINLPKTLPKLPNKTVLRYVSTYPKNWPDYMPMQNDGNLNNRELKTTLIDKTMPAPKNRIDDSTKHQIEESLQVLPNPKKKRNDLMNTMDSATSVNQSITRSSINQPPVNSMHLFPPTPRLSVRQDSPPLVQKPDKQKSSDNLLNKEQSTSKQASQTPQIDTLDRSFVDQTLIENLLQYGFLSDANDLMTLNVESFIIDTVFSSILGGSTKNTIDPAMYKDIINENVAKLLNVVAVGGFNNKSINKLSVFDYVFDTLLPSMTQNDLKNVDQFVLEVLAKIG